ncbi:MAG: glycosyltransferase family 4 protein [Pseudomonadota bacterium]
MTRRQIAWQDTGMQLSEPGSARMWVTVLSEERHDGVTLTPVMGATVFWHISPNGRHIRTCLFDAKESAIALKGLPADTAAECFIGSLPKPLEMLAAGSVSDQEALAEMIGLICCQASLEKPHWRDLPEPELFDLLRGGAAVARRLAFHAIEIALLEAALDVRSSTNIVRLLSYAHASAHNYPDAIIAAEKALTAQPELADGPFRDHLKELRAYADLASELRDIPASAPRSSTRGRTVAYCLHNALPHAQGGYAMRSHAFASAIVGEGRSLIAFARPGFPSDSNPSLDTVPAAQHVGDVRYFFENSFGRRGRAYGYVAEAADYFERAFAAHDIGLVHAATNFWTGLPAGIAARRLGLPFVYEVRSFWSITRDAREPGFSSSPQGLRDDALETMVLAMADQVLTLNEGMRDMIVDLGVDPERIALAPNCVDADLFAPHPADDALRDQFAVGPDDIVVGYMGAMLGYEGIDLLVEVVAPLIRENERIRLLIVGADAARRTQPGTIEYELGRQIDRLGMASHIRLVDRVPPETARELYTHFDICAYPRRAFEVCELVSPLKPLEAMAMGKTVIGSSVRALQDMIDHDRTGLVFDTGDIESLRAALSRAIGDDALRARLGEAARDFVQKERNWQHIAKTTEAVYCRAEEEDARTNGNLGNLVDAHFTVPASMQSIRSALEPAR